MAFCGWLHPLAHIWWLCGPPELALKEGDGGQGFDPSMSPRVDVHTCKHLTPHCAPFSFASPARNGGIHRKTNVGHSNSAFTLQDISTSTKAGGNCSNQVSRSKNLWPIQPNKLTVGCHGVLLQPCSFSLSSCPVWTY